MESTTAHLPGLEGMLSLCPVLRFDPAVNSMEELKRLMTYSRRFVQTVRLRQLPSHMDLTVLFDCMIK